MVVEHAGAVQQRLGEPERAPRIARHEHALGDRFVGAQVHEWAFHEPPMELDSVAIMSKDKKKKKDEAPEAEPAPGAGGDPFEGLRAVFERTFKESAGSTRDRAQGIFEELASAAGRVRETVDDLRAAEDLRGLRSELEFLARRVSALELRRPSRTPARTLEPLPVQRTVPVPAAPPADKLPAPKAAPRRRAAASGSRTTTRAKAGTTRAKATGTRATTAAPKTPRTRRKPPAADDAAPGRS